MLRFFFQQGRHVAPMAVKFGTEEGTFTEEGTKGPHGVPSSMPNLTPIGATIRV